MIIDKLFSSCSCCEDKCKISDWCMMGSLIYDAEFDEYDINIYLEAPCGKEALIFSNTYVIDDRLDGVFDDRMRKIVLAYQALWDEDVRLDVTTERGEFMIGKGDWMEEGDWEEVSGE